MRFVAYICVFGSLMLALVDVVVVYSMDVYWVYMWSDVLKLYVGRKETRLLCGHA